MNTKEKEVVKKIVNDEIAKLFYTLFKKKSFWQN